MPKNTSWRKRSPGRATVKAKMEKNQSEKRLKLFEMPEGSERNRGMPDNRGHRRVRSSLGVREPDYLRGIAKNEAMNRTFQDATSTPGRSNSRDQLNRTNRRAFYDKFRDRTPGRSTMKKARPVEVKSSNRLDSASFNPEEGRDPRRFDSTVRKPDTKDFRSKRSAEWDQERTKKKPRDHSNNRFESSRRRSASPSNDKRREATKDVEEDEFDFENLRSINPGRDSEHHYGAYEKPIKESNERSFIGKITNEQYKKRTGDGFRRYVLDSSRHLDTAFRLRKDKVTKGLEPPLPIYLKEGKH